MKPQIKANKSHGLESADRALQWLGRQRRGGEGNGGNIFFLQKTLRPPLPSTFALSGSHLTKPAKNSAHSQICVPASIPHLPEARRLDMRSSSSCMHFRSTEESPPTPPRCATTPPPPPVRCPDTGYLTITVPTALTSPAEDSHQPGQPRGPMCGQE